MPVNRENERRDKALESIAGHLKDINHNLSLLVKQGKPKTTVVRPDPYTQPQEPQPGDVVIGGGKDDKPAGPTFPKSDNPYFNQRMYDAEPEPTSLEFEGPYGDGNGQPYS